MSTLHTRPLTLPTAANMNALGLYTPSNPSPATSSYGTLPEDIQKLSDFVDDLLSSNSTTSSPASVGSRSAITPPDFPLHPVGLHSAATSAGATCALPAPEPSCGFFDLKTNMPCNPDPSRQYPSFSVSAKVQPATVSHPRPTYPVASMPAATTLAMQSLTPPAAPKPTHRVAAAPAKPVLAPPSNLDTTQPLLLSQPLFIDPTPFLKRNRAPSPEPESAAYAQESENSRHRKKRRITSNSSSSYRHPFRSFNALSIAYASVNAQRQRQLQLQSYSRSLYGQPHPQSKPQQPLKKHEVSPFQLYMQGLHAHHGDDSRPCPACQYGSHTYGIGINPNPTTTTHGPVNSNKITLGGQYGQNPGFTFGPGYSAVLPVPAAGSIGPIMSHNRSGNGYGYLGPIIVQPPSNAPVFSDLRRQLQQLHQQEKSTSAAFA